MSEAQRMSKRHVFLIGYRGSGKSIVATSLARLLGWPSVDTDRVVEASAEKSIAEIFEQEGMETFRDFEQAAVKEVAETLAPQVVSLGGGAVLRHANREVISQNGYVVWLSATPEVLHRRIVEDQHSANNRPQLTDRSGYDEVVSVLAERIPIYERLSEFCLATDRLSPDQVACEINDWLKSASRE